MKRTMILAAVLALAAAQAALAAATPEEAEAGLWRSLRFSMEMMVLSEDGSRVYRIEDSGVSSAGGEVGFSVESGGKRSLVKAVPFVDEAGPGVRITGAAQALRLKDYGAVVHDLGRSGGRRLVLRVSAFFQPEEAVRDFGDYQLRLGGRLIRNRNEVVLNGLTASSSGLIKATSPKFGTLRVSLKRFRGAKPVGVIEGSRLSFSAGGSDYEWIADDAIIGPGRWVAWVRHDAGEAADGRTTLGGAALE
ncbi:MAG: hypothetical protein HY928_05820 [Elusimicrobia bacterium]|nr:hypothetical protein [Elusimicrobiota bacterium]